MRSSTADGDPVAAHGTAVRHATRPAAGGACNAAAPRARSASRLGPAAIRASASRHAACRPCARCRRRHAGVRAPHRCRPEAPRRRALPTRRSPPSLAPRSLQTGSPARRASIDPATTPAPRSATDATTESGSLGVGSLEDGGRRLVVEAQADGIARALGVVVAGGILQPHTQRVRARRRDLEWQRHEVLALAAALGATRSLAEPVPRTRDRRRLPGRVRPPHREVVHRAPALAALQREGVRLRGRMVVDVDVVSHAADVAGGVHSLHPHLVRAVGKRGGVQPEPARHHVDAWPRAGEIASHPGRPAHVAVVLDVALLAVHDHARHHDPDVVRVNSSRPPHGHGASRSATAHPSAASAPVWSSRRHARIRSRPRTGRGSRA